MRPLFNSRNTLPKFPISPTEQYADAEVDAPPRDNFMGKELPTVDQPLGKTSQAYYNSIDHFRSSGNAYLNYMLLGLYPPGPYECSPNANANTLKLQLLILELLTNGQFTALNELIQRCEPLPTLAVDLNDFSPDQLTKFLATVSTYHPELPSLKITGIKTNDDPRAIDMKTGALADFISRSTDLKALDLSMIFREFSLLMMNAIAKANRLESLTLGSGISLSDEAADKLQEVIRKNSDLKSITFLANRVREEHIAKVWRALQCCPKLEVIDLRMTGSYAGENLNHLAQLIGKSPSLKQVNFSSYTFSQATEQVPLIRSIATAIAKNRSLTSVNLNFNEIPDIDAGVLLQIIKAAKRHPTLQKLVLNTQCRYRLPIAQALADLVETNKNIVDVGIELAWLNEQSSEFFDQLQNADFNFNYSVSADPWPDTAPPNSSYDMKLKKLCSTIVDKVARNKALASGALGKVFSRAFFPSPRALPGTNHIGDPGLVVTNHILSLSPGLTHFQNTMVEIALTVDETAKVEQTKENAPEETTNDQTIELRNTTNDDAKLDTRS